MKRKFNIGDKVYLDKRGTFGFERRDWTLESVFGTFSKLEKNTIYIVSDTNCDGIKLYGKVYTYNEGHFKKYEEYI